MPSKIKTAAVVLLLSGLIWFFAEQAVLRSTGIEVEIRLEPLRPDVLLQFIDEQNRERPEKSLRLKLQVEGPAGRIQKIGQQKATAHQLSLNEDKLGFTDNIGSEPQDRKLSVIEVFEGKLSLTGRGQDLRITEADPPELRVRLTRLVRVPLEVKVYDEYRKELTAEQLEPKTVEAYVKAGVAPVAKVILTSTEQTKASSELITVSAKVGGLARPSEFEVKVKLPAGGSPWSEETISRQRVRRGIVMPDTMVGKYDVEIENLDALLAVYAPIRFRWTTAEARDEFLEGIHLLLVVKEEDLEKMQGFRSLEYNLPAGDKIEIVEPRHEAARFRLIKMGE